MHVIEARNVNYAYKKASQLLRGWGEPALSRDGPVVVFPEPVATVYARPFERVLWDRGRDPNPFFHLLESLWMIQGRNDGRALDVYVKNFSQRYGESETGTMHGAYGHRWRNHFDVDGGGAVGRLPDQLETIAAMITRDPTTRRAVLAMWDPVADLDTAKTDIPCNTHIYFRPMLRGGSRVLDMTVCCRSNDLIMGMCGANAVHMSVLQEYMAAITDREVGTYTQISNNLHYYTRDEAKLPSDNDPVRCLYSGLQVTSTPLFNSMGEPLLIFDQVARLHEAWTHQVGSVPSVELSAAIECVTPGDWRRACQEWIDRRLLARGAREIAGG